MKLAPKDGICTLVSRGSLQEEREDLRSQREGEEAGEQEHPSVGKALRASPFSRGSNETYLRQNL